jgi:alpha-L-rhamnosidase
VRVGDEELTPGWTSYRHRLRYATFDVTEHLVRGGERDRDLARRRLVARSARVRRRRRAVLRRHLAALAQLEVVTADGARVVVAERRDVAAGPGRSVWSGLYEGERFDARGRTTRPGRRPGYAADGWAPARRPGDHVACWSPRRARRSGARGAPPVTVERTRATAGGSWTSARTTPAGCASRRRPARHEITLRHAEVLEHGELCREPLRHRRRHRRARPGGRAGRVGAAVHDPRVPVRGDLRVGRPPELPEDVVSRVIHSGPAAHRLVPQLRAAVDRFHENVVWSLRSNFVDVPTDCPQRDERLGWTGDLQVFAPTAAFLYDVSGFLGSWLTDLAAEQQDLGWVPPYDPVHPARAVRDACPRTRWRSGATSPTLTPACCTGRPATLEVLRRQLRQRPSAGCGTSSEERHPRRTLPRHRRSWATGSTRPRRRRPRPRGVTSPLPGRDGVLRALRGAVAGDRLACCWTTSRPSGWTTVGVRVAGGVRRRVRACGRRRAHQRHARRPYALTTVLGPVARRRRPGAGAARLAELVRDVRRRIATGFAGTPVMTDALTLGDHLPEPRTGCSQCTRTRPGSTRWLLGGTTIWERWDSMLPDGTVNPRR